MDTETAKRIEVYKAFLESDTTATNKLASDDLASTLLQMLAIDALMSGKDVMSIIGGTFMAGYTLRMLHDNELAVLPKGLEDFTDHV